MKFLLKSLCVSASFLCGASLMADTLVFKNGDKLTGSVVSQNEKELVFSSAFGEIKVDAASVSSVVKSDAAAEAVAETVAATSQAAPDSASAPAAADASKNASTEKEIEDTVDSWLEDYRKFVHENIPEGWEFKISGGYERRKTASSTNAFSLSFDAAKKWGESDEFNAKAYYEYASEKNSIGMEDTTTDNWGIITNYKHYFEDSSWFLTNTLSYDVDRVKGIRDEVNEILGLGYKASFFDDKLTIDLSVGPSVRYVNADGYDQHFVPMGTIIQNLKWQVHKYATLEESFYGGVSLTNVHEYNFIVTAGVVFKFTEVFDLALRYYYDYDEVNASSAQKSEERIMITFEIPLK